MVTRGDMAGKAIQDFTDFIKSQVLGIFKQQKTSMRETTEKAIRKLENKMPATVTMKIVGKQDFIPKVFSDIFTNVLYNLISNATSHGKASQVEVRINRAKRIVTVWDNGSGITSDILPRIFDLNFSTQKHGKNEGVGLAFVKMIIAA